MLTFTIRRLLSIPPLLFGVALMTFLLLKAAPADYFSQMEFDPAKSRASVIDAKRAAGLIRPVSEKELSRLGAVNVNGASWQFEPGRVLKDGTEIENRIAAEELDSFELRGMRYSYDDRGQLYLRIGALEGFGRWLGKVLQGDFGRSFKFNQPVFELISERLLNTLTLSIAALILAWGTAIPLGVIAAVKPNSFWDHSSGFIAFFGLSIPSVFFALLMILFASYTGWFPIGDMRDTVNYDNFTFWGKIWDRLHHLVLPTIVIGTGAMAGYMRQARGNMIEALGQDYVRTARAKGLPREKVLFKHALRNAINPLVTLFGYSLAALLSGSFLVEVVMNWPGMARLVVDAIIAKDEPVVMASVMVSAVLLVFGNLFADLLLAVVDPRVRLS
ncbi:MAG: ABC transporter permease [Planctomycetota bacterium]